MNKISILIPGGLVLLVGCQRTTDLRQTSSNDPTATAEVAVEAIPDTGSIPGPQADLTRVDPNWELFKMRINNYVTFKNKEKLR